MNKQEKMNKVNKKGQFTWGLALALIGAISFLWAMFGKMAKKRRQGVILLGIALVAFGFLPAYASQIGFSAPAFLSNDLGGTGTTLTATGGQQLPGISAQSTCGPNDIPPEDVTVTYSGVDGFTGSSAGGTHNIRFGSDRGSLTTVANDGTQQTSHDIVMRILWHNTTTTIPSDSYFSRLDVITVPCKGTFRVSTEAGALGVGPSDAGVLWRNGTLDLQIFDRDSGTDIVGTDSTNATANQSMTTGDVFTLRARLTGEFQRAFPYGGALIVQFNDTMDDIKVDFGNINPIPTPDFFTVTAIDKKTKTYEIPPVMGSQPPDGEQTGVIIFDASDTIEPAMGTGNDPIRFWFYPYDFYQDDDEGGKWKGPAVEDENDVALRGGITFFLYLT